MELRTWAIFALTFAGATLIPGPAMLLALKDGMEGGPGRSLPGILGVITAGIIWALISLSGLSLVLTTGTILFRLIKTAGALYLIWLGIKMLLSNDAHPAEEEGGTKSPGDFRQLYRRGFLVGIGNVKAILFYGAFFPLFLNPEKSLLAQYGILLSSLCVIIFLCMMLYSLAGGSIAPLLRKRAVRKGVDAASGALLISFGALLGIKE